MSITVAIAVSSTAVSIPIPISIPITVAVPVAAFRGRGGLDSHSGQRSLRYARGLGGLRGAGLGGHRAAVGRAASGRCGYNVTVAAMRGQRMLVNRDFHVRVIR